MCMRVAIRESGTWSKTVAMVQVMQIFICIVVGIPASCLDWNLDWLLETGSSVSARICLDKLSRIAAIAYKCIKKRLASEAMTSTMPASPICTAPNYGRGFRWCEHPCRSFSWSLWRTCLRPLLWAWSQATACGRAGEIWEGATSHHNTSKPGQKREGPWRAVKGVIGVYGLCASNRFKPLHCETLCLTHCNQLAILAGNPVRRSQLCNLICRYADM